MEWTKREVVETMYGLCSRGWVDMELLKGWFSDDFLKYAVSTRPLLLLLDGHSSHYNPEAIQHAKVMLVPHTPLMKCSHLIQFWSTENTLARNLP